MRLMLNDRMTNWNWKLMQYKPSSNVSSLENLGATRLDNNTTVVDLAGLHERVQATMI